MFFMGSWEGLIVARVWRNYIYGICFPNGNHPNYPWSFYRVWPSVGWCLLKRLFGLRFVSIC